MIEAKLKQTLDQGAYSLAVVGALYEENEKLLAQNDRYRHALERISSILWGGEQSLEGKIAQDALENG